VDVLVERCAAIDVGKDEVVACVRTPGPGATRRSELRTFASFTSQLEAMADWFAGEGVTAVVMEATGPYWKPVWYVLEERPGFDLQLVNAKHVKMVPGRKSDMADARWLAELLEHGLLRASFVPPTEIRELRDLTRYRKRLIQTHTAEQQRVQKVLEDAGIKLDSVASAEGLVARRAPTPGLFVPHRLEIDAVIDHVTEDDVERELHEARGGRRFGQNPVGREDLADLGGYLL
jgi:transposase